MKPESLLSALACLAASAALLVTACSSDDDVAGTTGTGAGGGATTGVATGGGSSDGACLLHNCDSDEQCAGCTEGRTSCLVEEHRCVACGQNGQGCPDGQQCSSFGKCVPNGLDCPTDGKGAPTITCTTSADCGACDPAHQVCDTATKKCVACTATDTSECQSTDVCEAGVCAPACPKTCQLDNDCGKCGTAENPAKACNSHKCSECSPTYACPAGSTCNENGVCIKPCGIDGQVKGTCDADADCTGCGVDADTYVCDFPINGGVHGTCKLTAAGCSDLGNGTVVLPEPWSEITNTCSNDADCAGVGIELNVGKILRDLTGIEQIKDANVEYGMNVCADIELANDISCGVCVPCKVDNDCNDIEITGVALDAFGPLGSIAAAILLDQVFGPNDHKVYMYCETIAAGYGACTPCPGLLNDCSVGGVGGGSGSCDHDTSTQGGPLDSSCGACEADICAVDAYCCTNQWDATCVGEVSQYCSSASCDHGECETGGALDASCTSCSGTVCGMDPYCCQTSWDGQCVSEADANCGGCN